MSSPRWYRRMPGRLLIFGVIGMTVLADLAYAGKRDQGATVSVVTESGPRQDIKGELIAVRSDAIILNAEPGGALTLAIADISTIRVHRKARTVQGAIIGMLAAGSVSFLLSSAEYKGEFMGGIGVAAWSIGGAAGGLLIGGLAGAGAGTDKTYVLKGASEPLRKAIVEELRKKARMQDYR